MLPKILLVDDEEEILEFLERVLRIRYTILKAENGQEALNILATEAVQLIVSDVMMPVMDGFEVFSRIQKLDKDVPVVAITAMSRPAEREKALKAGFCDYFVKPILEIDRFREIVYSHIGECANPHVKPSDGKKAA